MVEAYPGLQVCTFSFFARLHITSPAHCSRCLRLRAQWDAEGVAEGARVTEASFAYYIGNLFNSTAVFPTVHSVVKRKINGRKPVTLKSHLPEALNGTKGETAHS